MTNLTEKEQWEDGVYQIEKTDPVVGGPDGLSNRQGQQLANRTKYLKGLVDGLLSGARNAAVAVKLATARAIKLTGDATATGTFDGSADLSLTVTLADTGVAAGTYGGVTLDKKGRATSATTFLPVANGGTGNGSGQAPSATKLATARTINGVPFDGTANIAITDDSKAPLNSPVLTGDPRAPTPATGDNDTSIATTAFVQAAIAALVNGSPEALNQLNELAAALGNNPNYATDMATALGLKANSESPTLTGTPKAPRPAVGTNTDQIQTAAGVLAVLSSIGLGDTILPTISNLDGITTTYISRVNSPSTATTVPVSASGVVVTLRFSNTYAAQLYLTQSDTPSLRNRFFWRTCNSSTWTAWEETARLSSLATVATSGKFSDLLDQNDHVMRGLAGAAWKTLTLQQLEVTGSVSLEYRNPNGVTVMSSQGLSDGKGGYRPRMYYTKTGDATTDRRTYWGGVNDSDVVEFAGPMQVRQGGYLADQTGAALCVKSDATDGTGGLTVNSFAPTLAMVDRSTGARSARWKTDSNNVYLEWDNTDNGATWNSSVLSITPSGEFRSLSANNWRIIAGNYGTFWRNDGASLYLMLTASGDQHGNWNSLRPFAVDLASGRVVCSNGLGITTAGRGDNSTNAASTAYVMDATGSRTAEIVFFPSSTAPTGFLKANGAAVSRTTYAALFAVIGTSYGTGDGSTTFNLPDLRGEFLRGWDDGRGVDGGRVLNSNQASQNLLHSHSASAANAGAHNHTFTLRNDRAAGEGNAVYGDEAFYPGDATLGTSTAGDHTHTITIGSAGGNEARPRNVALLACIKY